ncbi:Crp/Fnr family transcriptional regulator [Spirillospora sp. NPDC050679]
MPTSAWPQQSFLGRLSPPARERLLGLGHQRSFQRGEVLSRQDERTTRIEVLLRGHCSVLAAAESGEVLLDILDPGSLVGEMAVIDAQPNMASVVARGVVLAATIDSGAFLAYLSESPEASTALMKVMAERIRRSNDYRIDAARYDVETRVARALLYQVERHASLGGWQRGARARPFTIDLRQSELAMLVGAKEGTVQKLLSRGRLSGLVKSVRGRIAIYDPVGLARLAEFAHEDVR